MKVAWPPSAPVAPSRLTLASRRHGCILAQAFEKLRDTRAAVAQLRRVIEVEPRNVEALQALGRLMAKQGQIELAAWSYRRLLALRPNDAEVRHFLAAYTPKAVPSTASPEYVKGLFDGYAERFDKHLVEGLQYHAPDLLRAAIGDVIDVESPKWSIMDLGCGTGLCGPLFRDLARRMIGVDLSGGMLAKARERGVYDELREDDVTSALLAEPSTLDLAIAADVFVYIGDLAPVFEACRGALRPGGWFAFTTEREEAKDIRLTLTGRFAHAENYVRGLAAEFGFDVLRCEDVTPRMESGKPVHGQLHVLRMPPTLAAAITTDR